MFAGEKTSRLDQYRTVVNAVLSDAEPYHAGRLVHAPILQFESLNVGLISVSHITRSTVGIWRQWRHIRKRSCQLYCIFFPLRGAVLISQDARHDLEVDVGNFSIFCGDRPFHVRPATPQSVNAGLQVWVPSQLLRDQAPNIDDICGLPFGASSGAGLIAKDIFLAIISEAGKLPKKSAAKLALSALELVTDVANQGHSSVATAHVNAKESHFSRVQHYIEKHVSEKCLTAKTVAKACGISERYIFQLMKRNETTFSDYMWGLRLARAHRWLGDSKFSGFAISEIASMSGFTSAAHFSDVYRKRYGIRPKDRRNACAAGAPSQFVPQ